MAWSSIGTRENSSIFMKKKEKEMLDEPIPCPKALQEISKVYLEGSFLPTRGFLHLL
jgi:hypothetical protein